MTMAFLTVLIALLVSVCSAQSEVCSVCQLVVSYAEKLISTNSSEAAIIQQLDNLCDDIPLFGQQCQSVVNQYAPQLIDWILNKENPQEFCAQVGLCSSLNKGQQTRPHHRLMTHHHRPHQVRHHKRVVEAEDQATCSICSLVVNYVEKWVAQNQTESQIIAQLQAFCSALGPLAPECNSFVATYAPQIITWIENKEPPSTVCAQIGACTSRKQVAVKATVAKQQEKRDTEQGVCQVCQLVVTYVEQLVGQNNTIAEIEQQVDAMCALLPSPINGACTSVVNQYLPQLVAWILQKEDPSTFCSSVGLC